jgi:hypothetical protein
MMNRPRPIPALPAPAILNRVPVLVGSLMFLLVPFFLPIPMDLRRHPLIGHLGDQVHVPFLMILTLMFYWRGPLTGRLRASALAAVVLGGSIEFLQTLVGRAALFHDFWLDLAGIGLAVGLVIWKGHQRRSGLVLMVSVVAVLTAQLAFLPGLIMGSYDTQKTFPVISNFEGKYEKYLWSSTYEARLGMVANESRGTVMRIESGPPSRWPGAQMRHFPPDWSTYSTLKVDVRHITAGRDTVPFSVRLDDFDARLDETWISDPFFATGEWTTYSLLFTGRQVMHGERMFNFHDVSAVLVFLSDHNDSTAIEVDNIRLE